MAFRYGAPFPPNEPDSWPVIQQIMQFVPGGLRLTDGQRPYSSPPDWHMFGMAADEAREMTDAGRAAMRDAAAFLIQFAEYFIEIIHTTPFDTDNGFYVKNGQVVGPGFYGPGTVAAHADHLHLAMSSAGANALLALLRARAAPNPTPPPVSSSPVLYGCDASDFNSVDLSAMAAEGIRFFTHKTTEQTPTKVFEHLQFGARLAAARDVGIPFLGAYMVPRSNVDPKTQAQTAIAFVVKYAPWLLTHPGFFWQVDIEKWGYDDVPAAVGEAVADALEQLTKRATVLYVSHGQYGDSVPGSRPLWNANYTGSGASRPFREMYLGDSAPGWVSYSGRVPLILQYCSDAVIGGHSPLDANVFRGTEDDFRRLIVNRVTPEVVVPVPPTPDPVLGDKVDPEAFNAALTVVGDQIGALYDSYQKEIDKNAELTESLAEVKAELGSIQDKVTALENAPPVVLPPTPTPTPPAPPQRTHTVVEGDTLSGIAAQYGVTDYMEIARLNNPPVTDPDHIEAGWVLKLP